VRWNVSSGLKVSQFRQFGGDQQSPVPAGGHTKA
jgi:hypothetical protein